MSICPANKIFLLFLSKLREATAQTLNLNAAEIPSYKHI